MIRLVQRSLAFNLPSLHQTCTECRRLIGLGTSLGSAVSGYPFSSVKESPKWRHDVRNAQPHKGGRRMVPEHRDPVRSVSDRLLLSLKKRHDTDFAFMEAGLGSRSSAVLCASSTQDLIHAVYGVLKNASDKTHQLDTLEKMLTKRLQKMTLAEAVQACHGFYLQEHRFHKFLSQTLSIIDEKFDDLCPTASEITHLLFFVFTHGSAPTMLLHRVEDYMLKHLDEFDINDLGVVCVGFFRANSRLTSQDLLDALAEKLLQDISSLEPFLLLDFVKTFRHASYIKCSFYKQLGDHLIKSKLLSSYTTLNPIMHIAFTYASIPFQHAALFEHLLTCAEQLLSRQKYIRTKDISKFVWACGTLQFRPEGYEGRYRRLLQLFEANSKDHRDYPESIAEMLLGLVYVGLFPHGLFDRCLSSDVANKLLESGDDREKSFQLLLLNETAKIECPDYRANLLTEGQIQALLQHPSVSRDLTTELQTRVGLVAVLHCLQRCLGRDKVVCTHPLLHLRTAVLELWYSKEHGFLEVLPSTSDRDTLTSCQTADTFTQKPITNSLYSALTKTAEKTSELCFPKNCARLAVVVTSSNQFALNNQVHPLGHLHTMLRQLHKAGYTVVEILPGDALQLELSSHEEKCHHLSAVLSSVLQTNIVLS